MLEEAEGEGRNCSLREGAQKFSKRRSCSLDTHVIQGRHRKTRREEGNSQAEERKIQKVGESLESPQNEWGSHIAQSSWVTSSLMDYGKGIAFI